ncbi:MAG: hypothetical protein PWP27_682 [Clostridiales bacterium]|jgi:xanthine/uracil permease|nr:hypothetical protein [Clostridiales bacterium]MDK2932872.1 hypothetical protein [Clostridiales bacterium]
MPLNDIPDKFTVNRRLPVGYATIFLASSNMINMALKEYSAATANEYKMFIISTSLMVGIGSMFVPVEALQYVPSFLASLLNNGLILGVITCILLEQGLVLREKLIIK